jgi:DNA-binding GntR family transcriptional regulator
VPPRVKREDPPYLQVANHLREQITSGELKAGERVPSEREIVEQRGVSRATATKALASLKADGLVESRPGSRTTVRSTAGLADFTLAYEARRIVIVHTPCGTRQTVSTLRDALDWADSHRCPTA